MRDRGGGRLAGKLLGLGLLGPLALADAVVPVPGDGVGHELAREVGAVDVQHVPLAAHAALAPLVPPRHAEPAPLVADEAVEGYLPPRAQVELDVGDAFKPVAGGKARLPVLSGRRACRSTAPPAGLGGAPRERLLVEAGYVGEIPAGQEVLLHEADQPLHLALRVGVARLAEPRLEADAAHEGVVVGLPDGAPVSVPPGDDAPHVVGEHVGGNPHEHEGVDHPYEEVLLSRVREELDVGGTAVVAHHREAGDAVALAPPSLHVHEAPVHLECLAGLRPVALPAAPLGRHGPSCGRGQVLVGLDVDLHRGEATLVSLGPEPLEDHLGVGDALSEQVVHDAGEAREHGRLRMHAASSMRGDAEALGLERPRLRSAEPGPPGELRQVYLVEVEPVARLGPHALDGLVYNLLQAIAFVAFPHFYSPPNAGALASPVYGRRGGPTRWPFSPDFEWLN